MPDQANYLFDNQYQPEVIDKAYSRIRATTWDHCINSQRVSCQQDILAGGQVTDFKHDEMLNMRLGIPRNSYTYYVNRQLLRGNQKYILEHFVKNKELFTLREMLSNPIFTEQFIFHFGEYVFMTLRVKITSEGTWLIIPIDEEGGITSEQMEKIQAVRDPGYPYDNRWFLEVRSKVSYVYTEEPLVIDDEHRIFLNNQFAEHKDYIVADGSDWKICVADLANDKWLMRVSPAKLKYDGGLAYLQISPNLHDHINACPFVPCIFAYNEADKVGQAVSINYLGPTDYLYTQFDEYVAAINNARLKVMVMNIQGGWTTVDGTDKSTDDMKDLIVLGFSEDQCWIAIPSSPGISPIHPGNFRVWEYDPEFDTLGRMASYDMTVAFPNLYLYRMKSDSEYIYIEWFRDDHSHYTKKYDDWTYEYRKFAGKYFYDQAVSGLLPSSIQDFQPVKANYSVSDFMRHIQMESWHDYRVHKMVELLKETGLHYSTLYEMLDDAQQRYRTIVLDMAKLPERYAAIKESGLLRFSSDIQRIANYDLYIDGVHIMGLGGTWVECDQYVQIPLDLLKPDSIIIVDYYYDSPQYKTNLRLSGNLVPFYFPQLPLISGSDIVVADAEGYRIGQQDLTFGEYIKELYVQIPYDQIDWEGIGVDPNSPEIVARTGVSEDGKFKAITFTYLESTVPDKSKLTVKDETEDGVHHYITTDDSQFLIIKTNPKFVTMATYDEKPGDGQGGISTNRFTRRINHEDIVLKVDNYPDQEVTAYNCDVYRRGANRNLSNTNKVIIDYFDGADDPNRLLPFLNGIMQIGDTIEGEIPHKVDDPFILTYTGDFPPNSQAEVIYLPFPVDRFEIDASENGLTSLAGTGVHCLCKQDIVFEDGKRIPVSKIKSITNQIVVFPTPGAHYTIIRLARDSNLFDFEDTETQSILDRLFKEVPDYRDAIFDTILHYQNEETPETPPEETPEETPEPEVPETPSGPAS